MVRAEFWVQIVSAGNSFDAAISVPLFVAKKSGNGVSTFL